MMNPPGRSPVAGRRDSSPLGDFTRFLAVMIVILLAACKKTDESAARGQQLITQYGCTSCHTIPGIKGPKGAVGPPLEKMALRTFIAGKVQNTPQNMIAWLQNPQAFDPGNAMPNLNGRPDDARDITAYLYTLK